MLEYVGYFFEFLLDMFFRVLNAIKIAAFVVLVSLPGVALCTLFIFICGWAESI